MAFVGALGFASCEDDVDYNPAPPVDGSKPMVFFDTNAPANVESRYKDENFSIKLFRRGSSEAHVANLEVTVGDPELEQFLSIPTSVSFAEGAMEADLTIGVSIEEGNEYPAGKPVVILLDLLDVDNVYDYGVTSYRFTYTREAPFKALGTGIFVDDFLSTALGMEPETYEVEIEQSILNPNVYRMKNVYSEGGPFWATGLANALTQQSLGVANISSASIEFDCSNPNEVHILPSSTGLSLDAALFKDVPVGEKHATMMGMCRDMFQDAADAPLGTLKNGVVSFPASSIALVVEGIGGMAVNGSGKMKIMLPGASAPEDEPQLSVTYVGVFTNPDGETNAVFNFDFNKQVSVCRVAVAKAADVATEEALKKLADEIAADTEGKISTAVNKPGKNLIAVNGKGDYVAVVVGFDLQGKPFGAYAAQFTVSSGEPVVTKPMEAFYGTYTMTAKSQLVGVDYAPATIKISELDPEQKWVMIEGLAPQVVLDQVFNGQKEQGFFIGVYDAKKGGSILLQSDLLYTRNGKQLSPIEWDASSAEQPNAKCLGGLAFGTLSQDGRKFDFADSFMGFNADGNLILKNGVKQYYVGMYEIVNGNQLSLVGVASDVTEITLTPAAAAPAMAAAGAETINVAQLCKQYSFVTPLASFKGQKTLSEKSVFVPFTMSELPANAEVQRPALKLRSL